MDELIKQVVAKKLRARGKIYKLSENSRLSTQDFGYANKIAGRIYSFVKPLMSRAADRTVYQKILAVVLKLVRSDEVHELGQLRIGYGNILAIKGLQFNARQSWPGFVGWNTEVVCHTADASIDITVPATSTWLFKRYDPRVSKLAVWYEIWKIPFELDEEPARLNTKELFFTPGEKSDARKASFSIAGWDNCLIVVVGAVQSYLWESSGQGDFLTANRSFMASGIIEVFGLREGKLLQDRVEEKSNCPPPEHDEGVDWD